MDVDTSSYPKPQQTNFLDTAGKYQGLAQGAVTLSQEKLKLMNGQWQTLAGELSTMANDPNTTKEQAAGRLTSFAKMANIPQPMVDKELAELNAAPDVQSWAKLQMVRGQSNMDKVNLLYGIPGTVNRGSSVAPVVTSPMFGIKRTGVDIPVGLSPETKTPDASGRQNYIGSPNPPDTIPAAPQADNRLGGAVQSRQQASGPTPAAMSPMWETGRQQYVSDQNEGSATFSQLRPLIQALPIVKQLAVTGPTTETIQNVAATLKNLGIIDINANDPTAQYQEVKKYLENYVSSHGSRSDAALQSLHASNPDARVQIKPALIKLIQNQIALDRINAVRSLAFNNNNFSEYGQHRVTFPANMDPQAFQLDGMEPKERATLIANMQKGLKSKNKSEQQTSKRFFDSLAIADKFIPEYKAMGE